jgi:cysteine desulfurase
MNETPRIYLDNAATTPMDPAVVEKMVEVMKFHFGNPSSTHGHGRKVKNIIEESRSKIAALLHCKPSEIFFTSGGTEADNLAIRGSVASLGIETIISSPLEHHAVLHTVEELAHQGKVTLKMVNILDDGHVDVNHLKQLLSESGKCLVTLMHANNEIGNMLDIEAVGSLVHQFNGIFHCDTVQTMGHYEFDLSKNYVDFICGAGHKFNGPKGVGFIYINKSNHISPLITGGAQEREMRGGTENVYGIVGLATALELSYGEINSKKAKLLELKKHMIHRLKTEFQNVEFNGDAEGDSLYTVLSVSFPPTETGNLLLFNLDLAGISCSGGSACSSGAVGGSHVIKTIRPNTNRTTVRFSFGKFNSIEDVDTTIDKLKTWYN